MLCYTHFAKESYGFILLLHEMCHFKCVFILNGIITSAANEKTAKCFTSYKQNLHGPMYARIMCCKERWKKKVVYILTVSGPTTFAGGGICRSGFRNSGPGLFLDKRLRMAVCEAKLPANPFPGGLAAKSRPCK